MFDAATDRLPAPRHPDRMPAPRAAPIGLPRHDARRFLVPPRTTMLGAPGAGFGLLLEEHVLPPERLQEAAVDAPAEHLLAIPLGTTGPHVEARLGGRLHRLGLRRHAAIVLPAGLDSLWAWRGGGERFLQLHMRVDWLARVAAEAGHAARPLDPTLGREDPGLSAAAAALLRRGADTSPMAAEAWAVAAALRLLGFDGGAAAARRHRIAPARLAAVRRHVEERLATPIGLAELAAVAGLSRFHFARAFRAETGVSPHAFVTERRCARAMRLILENRQPLAGIAVACGFASQSHFTHVFRRVVGTTPGRWRDGSG